jgi:hypothetical protein
VRASFDVVPAWHGVQSVLFVEPVVVKIRPMLHLMQLPCFG